MTLVSKILRAARSATFSLSRAPARDTAAARRRILHRAFVATGLLALRAHGVLGAEEPRVIKVTARRFEFVPNEIPLKAGERVAVLIGSIDFAHGDGHEEMHGRFVVSA